MIMLETGILSETWLSYRGFLCFPSVPPGKCYDSTSVCKSLLPGPILGEGMTAFCVVFISVLILHLCFT